MVKSKEMKKVLGVTNRRVYRTPSDAEYIFARRVMRPFFATGDSE